MLSAIFLSIISISGMASTPPIQPSLVADISHDPVVQNASFSLLFTWDGYVSYNIPPEYLVIEVFDLKDGSKLGSFSVPRQNDACEPGSVCTYSSSVDMGSLPPGEFMLVAHDPLSGVATRHQVTIRSPGKGSTDLFDRSEQDPAFFVVSGILVIFLIAVLAILIGGKKTGE
jgi:hypothetical protein